MSGAERRGGTRVAALLATALLLAACQDGPQAPHGDAGKLALQLSLQGSGVAEAYDAVNRIRLVFTANGNIRLQRDLPFDPTGAEARVPVDVPLSEDVETLMLGIELRRNADPVFRGGGPVVLSSGAATPVAVALEPVPFEVACGGDPVVLDAVGATATLDASVLFVTGDLIPEATVVWSAADPEVASVQAGVVTAGQDGNTVVTCRAGELTDTRVVQVLARVASVEVTPTPTQVSVGGTRAMSAILRDPGGTPITTARPLAWSSSNEQIATVDANGVVAGLVPGTVQITATSGQASGSAQVTVRHPAPTVTTLEAVGVSGFEATIRGSVNPNASATQAWFEWGVHPQLVGAASTPPQSMGAGTQPQSIGRVLSNLSPGATYYFRVAATNSFGTERGEILSFQTTPVPEVEVLEPDVDGLDVLLAASVEANGLSTDAWFEWSTEAQLQGSSETPRRSIGSGGAAVLVEEELTNLTPATVYYFRAHAENAAGSTVSPIHSFETPGPGPPVVQSSSGILRDGSDGLELAASAEIDPRGAGTRILVEVWEDSLGAFMQQSTPMSLPAGYGLQNVNVLVEFLNPSTGVYFRFVADNQYGRTNGPIQFTPVPPGGVSPDTPLFAKTPAETAGAPAAPPPALVAGRPRDGDE
jgi:hypothetical protein